MVVSSCFLFWFVRMTFKKGSKTFKFGLIIKKDNIWDSRSSLSVGVGNLDQTID